MNPKKFSFLKEPNDKKEYINYITLFFIFALAFSIRLFSVTTFESVIHEFDPWFNYRVTKYMIKNGFYAFNNWFDTLSWYPYGREMGKSTYPGMMWTSASIYNILKFIGINIDIKDICVFFPPIMAVMTCLMVYLITKHIYNSKSALISAFFIAIIPGYLSRSVAGAYDYESVAVFAIMTVSYFWLKSIHTGSILDSLICALSYLYMVSTWGGYIFIINIIPLHVLVIVLLGKIILILLFSCILGKYNSKIYISYSLFYTLGSLLTLNIKMVKIHAFNNAETFPAMAVFGLLQVYHLIKFLRENISKKSMQSLLIYFSIFIILVPIIFIVLTDHYRIKRDRIQLLLGISNVSNLVNSISEHQSTSWSGFANDLNIVMLLSPVGIILLLFKLNNERIFIVTYSITATYFASTMIRLIVVQSPILCILSGIAMSEFITGILKINMKNCLIKTLFFIYAYLILYMFILHSIYFSKIYSNPTVILASSNNKGEKMYIDDFREGFSWLKHNTKKDAKILSWWDYGYQITGFSNRTVFVDNNTNNSDHIGIIGSILCMSEKDAYPVLVKLKADYILVLFGGLIGYDGDDINKFPWILKITSGKYGSIKEADYYTNDGSYSINDSAPKKFRDSIIYKTSYYKFIDGKYNGYDVTRRQQVHSQDIRLEYLEEVYTTKNWLFRIYRVKK